MENDDLVKPKSPEEEFLSQATNQAESTRDKLHRSFWQVRTDLMFTPEEKMSMEQVKQLFKTGTDYRRDIVDGFLTETKRKKFTGEGLILDQEDYWQRAEYFFDDWQKWDNARLALEGKAPILKAIDLLVELEQDESEALSKMQSTRLETELGLTKEEPKELQTKIVMEDKMIASFRAARKIVELDYAQKRAISF